MNSLEYPEVLRMLAGQMLTSLVGCRPEGLTSVRIAIVVADGEDASLATDMAQEQLAATLTSFLAAMALPDTGDNN